MRINGKNNCIYVAKDEDSAVLIAAKNLAKDLEKVFGTKVRLVQEKEQANIRIRTLKEGSLQEDETCKELLDDKGELHWEGFMHQLQDECLHIVGSDRRGTIFGIYDLSEMIGVSPWYDWADVPVRKAEEFILEEGYKKVDWPSVAYRGIFLNDEEELEEWAKQHTKDGTIGPEAYARIFELILRLKGNYIWPAMHVNYFNENPKNNALAQEMGIVVGTSHCDMLMRSNQNEWAPWIQSKGYEDVVYDYSIEGKNRDILKEYWEESVELNKNYEVGYTMGMRGIHDSGFHTKSIDENQSLQDEDKARARVELLEQVIRDQGGLLEKVLGEEKSKKTLRTFVPYKEVLGLYNQGLEVPEDLTLIWANDNYGHVRRLPNKAERTRSGGNGLYYHCSYWAPGSMSYLWINSIPLAQIGNELQKSYDSGIQKVWVINVGGLKPVEQEMEFFLRCGWEAGKENNILRQSARYTKEWIHRNFSKSIGEQGALEVALLYERFAQVTNVRKLELMNSFAFSQEAYGDEAASRIGILKDLFEKGNELYWRLEEEEREAFFQLMLMKIHASYYTNLEYYFADRSRIAYDRGWMQAADGYCKKSVEMMRAKRRMIHYYNHKMSGGKWEKIMTPEEFSPPITAIYPTRKPAIEIGESALGYRLHDLEEKMIFTGNGQDYKWVELGNLGEGEVSYRVEVMEGKEWLHLGEQKAKNKEDHCLMIEGNLQEELRLGVWLLKKEVESYKFGRIRIEDRTNQVHWDIEVRNDFKEKVPKDFSGFIESDGFVCVPAAAQKEGWLAIDGLGRHEGALMMALETGKEVSYEIFLHSEGSFELEFYRFLTLDSVGKIRIGIAVDDHELSILESPTVDEWTGNWKDSIYNNGEKLYLKLPHLEAGRHQIRILALDPYISFTKFIIYTKARKWSQLGPGNHDLPRNSLIPMDITIPRIPEAMLEDVSQRIYRTKNEEVELPKMEYAEKGFYEDHHRIVYVPCTRFPQKQLGKPIYQDFFESKSKKNLRDLLEDGVFTEREGKIAIEAEAVLLESENAYRTYGADEKQSRWEHLQAESDGGSGFAMQVEEEGLLWENPKEAPGMHYRIQVKEGGIYQLWFLVRHYDQRSDSCYISLDGVVGELKEQAGRGNLNSYNTSYIYYWCHMKEIHMEVGEHTLSIYARKSQLRIDRIYLSKTEELPPADALWGEI